MRRGGYHSDRPKRREKKPDAIVRPAASGKWMQQDESTKTAKPEQAEGCPKGEAGPQTRHTYQGVPAAHYTMSSA